MKLLLLFVRAVSLFYLQYLVSSDLASAWESARTFLLYFKQVLLDSYPQAGAEIETIPQRSWLSFIDGMVMGIFEYVYSGFSVPNILWFTGQMLEILDRCCTISLKLVSFSVTHWKGLTFTATVLPIFK